jgi:hypothetical protein
MRYQGVREHFRLTRHLFELRFVFGIAHLRSQPALGRVHFAVRNFQQHG